MKKQAAVPRNSRAAMTAEALAQAVAAGNRGDLGEAERIARDVIARKCACSNLKPHPEERPQGASRRMGSTARPLHTAAGTELVDLIYSSFC